MDWWRDRKHELESIDGERDWRSLGDYRLESMANSRMSWQEVRSCANEMREVGTGKHEIERSSVFHWRLDLVRSAMACSRWRCQAYKDWRVATHHID